MTDLGQQQGGQPQFYAQPQMMQQPYGSQPMVYSPQQVAYPPQPQAPMGYSHEGVPQVSYVSVSPYVQNEPQVFIQQGGVPQEHVGYDMGEVPMKNYNHVEEHSYEHEEQKPDHFVGFIDHDPIQTLPSVVTCSDVINWFKEAWHMYAENWVPYTLVALIFMIFWGGSFVADDEAPAWVSTFLSGGTLLTMPLYWGFFIAGTQVYKQKERLLRESNGACVHVVPQFVDFFRGYFLFFPLWGLGIVLPLIVGLGFLLFIIPGIYLLVTLYFTCYVYIEYHPQHQYEATQHHAVSYGFCESIAHTRRVAHQHFWEIGFFILLQWAIAIIGSCTIVGGLIAFPVASLAMIPAFRDLYGFQMNRVPDERCYCCC